VLLPACGSRYGDLSCDVIARRGPDPGILLDDVTVLPGVDLTAPRGTTCPLPSGMGPGGRLLRRCLGIDAVPGQPGRLPSCRLIKSWGLREIGLGVAYRGSVHDQTS
jgi:hypothetical protein